MGMIPTTTTNQITKTFKTINYVHMGMIKNYIYLSLDHKYRIQNNRIFFENKENGQLIDINTNKKIKNNDSKHIFLPFYHRKLHSYFILMFDYSIVDFTNHLYEYTPFNMLLIRDNPFILKMFKIYGYRNINYLVINCDVPQLSLKLYT